MPSPREVRQLAPQAIVLSPGPCTPQQAGCSLDLVRHFHQHVPILGICLGHQTIVAALGGNIIRCEPRHGRVSKIRHDATGVFRGVPSPFTVCRYHSLAADFESLPEQIDVTSWSDDGVIMAVAHRRYPVIGLQFHPESILTEHGYQLLANFLQLAGLPVKQPIPTWESELARNLQPAPVELNRPVTF